MPSLLSSSTMSSLNPLIIVGNLLTSKYNIASKTLTMKRAEISSSSSSISNKNLGSTEPLSDTCTHSPL